MILLTTAFVFIVAFLGGLLGALAGEYYLQKRIAADMDAWFGEKKAPPAKVMALVKPTKRDEQEWSDAPGPIGPTEERRKKAKVPISEED